MRKSLDKIVQGYKNFRSLYAESNNSVMRHLANNGQQPEIMVVSCCDSRVDPALLLQCAPGDLFVVRNVANIVPTYENDEYHHGTSAALEFGICYLNIKHLVILGHSQCGGINALINRDRLYQDDFISKWVDLIKLPETSTNGNDIDSYAKLALLQSYQNCLTFPWIKERLDNKELEVHLWFFDIKSAEIHVYDDAGRNYRSLDLY